MSDVLFWRRKVAEAWQEKTHPQQPYMRPYQFKSLVAERGFHIWEDNLETWDCLGVFHPLLRVKYAYSMHRATDDNTWPGWEGPPIAGDTPADSNLATVIHEWDPQKEQEVAGIFPAIVEVPSIDNFVTWQNYEERNEKWGMRVNTGTILYHPYQIFRFKVVAESCSPIVHYNNFSVPDDTTAFTKQEIENAKTGLIQNETGYLKCLLILLSIEDRYLPALRGERHSLHLTSFGFNSKTNGWFEFQANFNATSVLDSLPFSIDEIKEFRRDLAQKGSWIDPNRAWFDLIRHIPYARRQKLHGNALLAWDYYEAAEIIGDFLGEATGEAQPHVDDLLHGGHWKKSLYGVAAQDIDYKSGNALKNILAHYTIDPRLKVLLLVEGESEIQYIQTWCDQHGLDLSLFGIRLFNLRSVDALKAEHVKQIVRAARQDSAAVVVVVDDEHKSLDELQNWVTEGLIRRIFSSSDLQGPNHPVGGMVWTPCFEDANFPELDDLLLGWSDFIQAHPKNFIVDLPLMKLEVQKARAAATAQKPCDSWIKAMELSVRTLHYPFKKPEIARCLALRFGDTERPLHRLINHAIGCAVLSTNYGPTDAHGGYGGPDVRVNN